MAGKKRNPHPPLPPWICPPCEEADHEMCRGVMYDKATLDWGGMDQRNCVCECFCTDTSDVSSMIPKK